VWCRDVLISTRLAIVIMQHNMLAASRIYKNISFTELGVLLGIPAVKVCAGTGGLCHAVYDTRALTMFVL